MIRAVVFGGVGAVLFLTGVFVGAYQLFPFDELRTFKRSLLGYNHDLNTSAYRRQLQQYAFFERHHHYSVIMLGDSITRGAPWCELTQRADVVNRGITGDTTNGVLGRIALLHNKARQIFLMIGINDIKHAVPMEQIQKNYEKILHDLAMRNYQIVVQSTLYTAKDDYNQKIAQLNTYLQHYCKEHSIAFVDLNRVLSSHGKLRSMFSDDGIHLNFEGYRTWWGAIQDQMYQPSGLQGNMK